MRGQIKSWIISKVVGPAAFIEIEPEDPDLDMLNVMRKPSAAYVNFQGLCKLLALSICYFAVKLLFGCTLAPFSVQCYGYRYISLGFIGKEGGKGLSFWVIRSIKEPSGQWYFENNELSAYIARFTFFVVNLVKLLLGKCWFEKPCLCKYFDI